MQLRTLALLLASACDALVAPARRRPGRVALRAASLEFSKYQGLGNDFLLVDNRDAAAPKATPAQAQRLCDRHFGVGADGVIFVMPGDAAHDFRMTIYNSDGSEPEMCGNGIRCLAAYLGELGAAGAPRGRGEAFTIATGAGPIVPLVLPLVLPEKAPPPCGAAPP